MSFLTVISLITIGVIYFLMIFAQVSKTLPSVTDIGNLSSSEGTKIFYADGKIMAILSSENRLPIKLADTGKYLAAATVAIEDKRFYEHPGIDMHGVARAIWRNITHRDMFGQGASTITQQLARNINELGLTKEKKLRRKVAEAILAMRLEQTYSKDEILELYLNQVYYGNGAYGVESAARAYFHKSAKELSLGESAMLAGLPQRPSLFSENTDAAYRRRDEVLDRMVENGKIAADDRDKARAEAVKMYKARPQQSHIYGAPYFVNYVISQVERDVRGNSDNNMGPVYNGWKIYTTLDSRIQDCAEKSLQDGISKYGRYANQGALISIDPKTGYIRAMVGGLDFKRQQFNVVTNGNRQAGSSFKPIVYTSAIDTGVCDLDKTYIDDPTFAGEHEGNTWHPKNYGGKYSHKSITVLSAIEHSTNTVAVKVAMETGLKTVIDYAHRMGISSEIDAYPTLALGAWSTGVKPIELCSAYTVFANNGKRAIPTGILKVVASNGDVIEEASPRYDDPQIKDETIQLMNRALRGVVESGTGTAAAAVPNAHGKTGTTSDNRDAWFAGYTPELTTVVWAGYMEMPGATGGHLCAPIWRDFMIKAVPIQQIANRDNGQSPSSLTETGAQATKQTPPNSNKPLPTNPVTVPGNPDMGPNTTAPVQDPSNLDGTTTTTPGPSPDVIPPSAGQNPGAAAVTSHRPDTTARMSEPTGRIASPAPRRDGGDDIITVLICADSGRRANEYCPTTISKRMARRSMPGICRVHHAPE